MKKCSDCGYPNPDRLTYCFQCNKDLEPENIVEFLEVPVVGQTAKIKDSWRDFETTIVRTLEQDGINYHIQVVGTNKKYVGKVSPRIIPVVNESNIPNKAIKETFNDPSMSILGLLLIIAGIIIVGYFMFIFDPSVSVPGGEIIGISRVNNLGLMSEKQNWIIGGFVCIILGTAIRYLEYFKQNKH